MPFGKAKWTAAGEVEYAVSIMRGFTLFPLTLLFSLSACSSSDSNEPSVAEGPGEFVSNYSSSPEEFFTLMPQPVSGESPHGMVRIWYSNNIRQSMQDDQWPVPVGTVSIKEADPEGDGEIDAITVMVKQAPGFDPDNGDWLYEMRRPDGGLMTMPDSDQPMQGAIEMCINCHSAAADTDFLAGTALR